MFPKVPDQHKPNKPLVPNGLGAVYVLINAVYLFFVYLFDLVKVSDGVSPPLTLAVCILFGGFLGLLDDWIDLRWRFKAFLPLIAAIPLASFAYRLNSVAATPNLVRTQIAIPFVGTMDFGVSYFFIIIPLLVTIITNTTNQLGGLNGLETICPTIVMAGLLAVSGSNGVLLVCPLIVLIVLAFFNFRGRIFVGNTGSFAFGTTLAAFSIISDLKLDVVVSILPYVFNSALILLTFLFFRTKANVEFDGKHLVSTHRRSLITLITYRRPLTERKVVLLISALVAITTATAVLVQRLTLS